MMPHGCVAQYCITHWTYLTDVPTDCLCSFMKTITFLIHGHHVGA